MTSTEKAPLSPGEPEAPNGRAAASRPRRHEVTSAELFAGGREVQIRHADGLYTLRQTSKGKLILTK